MAEVKALYEKRQYKQCSARCKQLLENIRDPVSKYVVPVIRSIGNLTGRELKQRLKEGLGGF